MEEINVDMWEYKEAKAPDELYSGGVGPCIVIGAIYGRRGYMIHEPPQGDISSFIEPFFAGLRKDIRDVKKLKIYVIGGEIESGGDEEVRSSRNAVLDKIKEHGFQDVERVVQWCPTNHTQSMRLILSEGRAEIDQRKLFQKD